AAGFPDRDVQAQQRQPAGMAHRRTHQARQQLAQQSARRAHALGMESCRASLTGKPKAKGAQAPLTVQRGKNDEIDAAAICEAMSRPTVQARFVPIKTAEQQAALTMLGVR